MREERMRYEKHTDYEAEKDPSIVFHRGSSNSNAPNEAFIAKAGAASATVPRFPLKHYHEILKARTRSLYASCIPRACPASLASRQNTWAIDTRKVARAATSPSPLPSPEMYR